MKVSNNMNKLPKVETVRYSLNIPELSKKVDYRPFTIREHKLVLEAIEKNDPEALTNVIVDIVEACTFNKVQINTLPMHLVDYIYLHIHKKSVGNINAAQYSCGQYIETDEGVVPCGAKFQINIPLDMANIVYPENFEGKRLVMVTDNIGMKLRIPTFEEFRSIKPTDNQLGLADQFIYTCIESIFDSDKVYQPQVDFTREELSEWLDNLDGSVMEKIGEFFDQLPYLSLELPITCPKCHNKEIIKLRGIDDFFV